MSGHTPTPDEVARIASLGEPVLRNLLITQCYADLAHGARGRVADGANWCAFATWASRQAGRTIRGEDLRGALERAVSRWTPDPDIAASAVDRVHVLGGRLGTRDLRDRLVARLDLDAVMKRSADAVARGNLRVFEEIGLVFAQWLEAADADGRTRVLDGLRPGEPPDGQELLREAFLNYTRAANETEAVRRAQLALCANLQIGVHEQTRLQPEIAAALDAALPATPDVVAALLAAALPFGGWWARTRIAVWRRLGRRPPLDDIVDALLAGLRRALREALTEHLMVLELDHGRVLRLGRDLSAAFPPSLRRLTEPGLLAFLARVDPTPDSTRATGARDWADLPARMHYIADLFRAFHQSEDLYAPPFDEVQIRALRAGQMPEGRL